MKIEEIKKIREYTNNIEILKLTMGINYRDIKYVINIYERLSENGRNISEEKRDMIVKSYIKNRLMNDVIAIEKLINNDSFLDAVENMGPDTLKRYLKYCKTDTSPDSLFDSELYRFKLPEEHIRMIEEEDKAKRKAFKLTIVLSNASAKYGINTARIFASYKKLDKVEAKYAYKLLKNEKYYEGKSETDVLAALSFLTSLHNPVLEEIACSILAYVPKAFLPTNENALKELVAHIRHSECDYSILKNKSIFEKNSVEEIKELLDLSNQKGSKILINEKTVSFLTKKDYDKIRDIIEDPNTDDSRVDAPNEEFARKLIENKEGIKNIIEDEDKTKFKEKIISLLLHQEYKQTVYEYLATCKSLDEFLDKTKHFNDNDDVLRQTLLTIKA